MEGNINENKIPIGENFQVVSEVLQFIPQEAAETYNMVPLAQKGNILHVGAITPDDLDARDALNFIAASRGFEYKIQKITKEQLNQVFQQYEKMNDDMVQTLEQLEQLDTVEDVILGIEEDETITGGVIQEDAPIIKFVSNILSQAINKRASDVHIEILRNNGLIRFRVDGVLGESIEYKKHLHNTIVSRIKIMSKLRLDERRKPQDGRFTSRIKDRIVDFRVASFPTMEGEKITLRVLDRRKGVLNLSELGLRDDDLERMKRAIKRPHGLILATGPTGSGKTTTLFALVNLVDRKRNNIISLEDPVEYRLDGINQSTINPSIGYSFATGLRSVLRGDPNQILVGEIRDRETAQLAVQAALTGHLVYSTLHTNTAIGAITRLINFGIDPFLLAPTIRLVIGQRMLLRFDGDKKEEPIGDAMKRHINSRFEDLPQSYKSKLPDFKSLYEVVPTENNPSGMKGRIGVFEVLEVDKEIQSIILDTHLETDIYASARKNGYITIGEDAIIKGLTGEVPKSEVFKLVGENSFAESEPLEGGV